MPSRPSRQLVTFPNPSPRREYVIRHECPEYTALCPVTGHSAVYSGHSCRMTYSRRGSGLANVTS